MFSVDVPRGIDGQPLVPGDVWATFPPAAQAVIVALAHQVAALTARVRELETRLGQDSSNSWRSWITSRTGTATRRLRGS